MNKSTGGKSPLDQRKMAGYGSGIHGVTRKPSSSALGTASDALPTMQQGMTGQKSYDIGNMPSQPRFSNSFSQAQSTFVNNSPTYEAMPSGPMQIAPMGTANQKPTMRNRVSNGFKRAKPLLLFTTIAGVTYLSAKALSRSRSASRDNLDLDPEFEDE